MPEPEPTMETVDVTRGELRDEFAALLQDGLPYVLGALSLLAFAYAYIHGALIEPTVPAPTWGALLAAGLLYLGLFFISLKREIPDRWAYPLVGTLALIILTNLITIGLARQAPWTSSDFILLLVAEGLVLLDRRWLVPVAGLTVAGWALVAGISPGHPEWTQFGYWILTAAFVAGVLNIIRSRTVERQLRAKKFLAQQNEELALLRDEAQAADRAKSALLANTSHEIRTPMNAIIGMTSLLKEEDLPETARHFVDTIQKSSDHLLLVINDILDLSKLEADSFDLEAVPFRLPEVVDDAVALIQPRADAKSLPLNVTIEETVPDAILGDPVRMRQILANLLSNAVKFTEEGRIDVHVRSLGETEGIHDLEIEIRDTGIGIPEDGREHLFEPFTQIDPSTTRRYGGTGLGLSIVKHLAEAMGGTVGVESTPGQGSRFWVQIPAQEAPTPGPLPWDLRPGDLRGHRVLVVDDNDTNRMILERQLKGWSLEPVLAENAEQALQHVQDDPPDLALLDYHMPETNGAQLASRLRELRTREELPIIMLSSGALSRDMIESGSVHLDGFLTKPPSPSILYDLIIHLLSPAPEQGQPTPSRPASTAHADKPPKEETLGGTHPLSILIAEDSAINQHVLEQMLAHLGYEATCVANGQEAIQAAKDGAFDVILMDIQMPVMDGVEATHRLREDPPEAGMPRIVALTAHALASDRERLLSEGMDDYVAKPVDLNGIQALLRRLAQRVEANPTQTRDPPPGTEDEPREPQP